nr:ubiquitin carboxyl-terminal hydrolase 34-like [Aotus nancymaae]
MGPVRMISSGHELTTDYDEKALHELGFKDMQMVFVSLGAPRRERKGEGVQLPASCLPPPQKDNIPMLLLLQEPHLTTLFDLLEMLASFKPPSGKVAVDDSEVIMFDFHKSCFVFLLRGYSNLNKTIDYSML